MHVNSNRKNPHFSIHIYYFFLSFKHFDKVILAGRSWAEIKKECFEKAGDINQGGKKMK
jgi:hypothetical protein